MQLKEISFNQPEENILFDDVLLYLAEQGKGDEVLRFWESPKIFIVLGKIGSPKDDIHIEKALRDKIPVLRRSSGGGTVLQGQGCLNFSLILSKEKHPKIHDLRKSYRYILDKVIGSLSLCGYECVFKPISDIALKQDERKFSGNAQTRGKRFILHHGTILYNFDLALIERYLKIPRDFPEYRRSRGHLDFLTNIHVPAEKIKRSLCEIWHVQEPSVSSTEEETGYLKDFSSKKDIRVDLLKFLS